VDNAGFVWAPTAQLVYWGLQNFDTPPVRKARLAFVDQMQTMFMEQWHLNHHCCENFSPFKVCSLVLLQMACQHDATERD
jgi:hypothetical protein